MCTQWLRIAAGRCVFLAAALQAACMGGEGAEREKLRAAWEETCFQAACKPVHDELVTRNEDMEGKDRGLDPFSPEHFLSQAKPNMKPKPLPEQTPGTQLRDVKIENVTISAPIPPDMKAHSTDESRIWSFGKEGHSIFLCRSLVYLVKPEMPKDVREKLEKAPEGVGVEGLDAEFRRLKAMPEFDLLVAIKNSDVNAFAQGVPFPRRVAGLFVFSLKWVFGPWRGVTCQYYEGKNMRCFVTGPEEYTMESVDPDTGKVRKAEPGEYRKTLIAEFAFREHNAVFELRLCSGKAHADRVTVAEALAFLANCKLKSVEKAGTEPGK